MPTALPQEQDLTKQQQAPSPVPVPPQPTAAPPAAPAAPQLPNYGSQVTPETLRSVLDPVQVDRSIKHDAWDAWHAAQTPEDFRKAFDAMNLPRATKRALWDLKFQPPIEGPRSIETAGQARAAGLDVHPGVAPSPLGRFEGVSRIGEAILRGIRAPGSLFGPPTPEEQQLGQQPQQSLQQILQEAQRTGQDPEEVARQTAGGRMAMEGGYISPRPFVDIGAATGARPGTVGAGAAQAASALISPAGLAQLATVPQSRLINMAFTGQMGLDTARALWTAGQKYLAGDVGGAHEALGGASVSAVMTALTALGLRPEAEPLHTGQAPEMEGFRYREPRPGPRETVQPAPVTQAPSPAPVQVAPRQEPSIAQEGGPRPVTSPGVSGGREIGGAEPASVASAPIERGGVTGGAPTQEPGPQEPISTPVSVQERARQTAARAYQEGLFPERRMAPGVSPTGMERRTQAERDYAAAIASTPPGQPTPGEQLAQEIRQARAGAPSGITEGQAMQRIMRDPALYEQFRRSDSKAQGAMLIAAKNAILGEQGAQRPTGLPQAPTPTAPAARPEPLPSAGPAEEPAAPTGQPLRPQQEPVRQPVPEQVTPKPPAYRPLPPEQRPRVRAGEPRPAVYAPETVEPTLGPTPAERKPAEIQPGVPATPRPKAGSAEQVEAWKGVRREEAKTREASMREEAPYKLAIERAERSALGAALDRHLAPPGDYKGDRGAELVAAVQAVKQQGPEAIQRNRDEMSNRAQRASQMAKWGQDILSAQDLDTALRNKLHEAELGKMEFEGGRMTAGGRWIGGAAKGEGTPTPKVVRQHPNELTAFWNRVRGNAMRAVPALGQADISKTAEGEASLRQYDDELRAILDQIRGNGGQFTTEQENRASTLIAGMNAIRGTAEIAKGGPQAKVGPEGALEFTGTKASREIFNRFMGRSEEAHWKKPSREEIENRVSEWKKEAEWAGGIAKDLGATEARPLARLAGREEPAQPPKGPVAAPAEPVEPRKPAPEAPKEPARVIPTTREAGKIARADVPAHAEEVTEIRREREAAERKAAEPPKPAPKAPTPIREITPRPKAPAELEKMVGEARPEVSPEARARYDAARERVIEQYASERAAHQAKLREVQALRSIDPKDYTPEFVDRLERYGQGLRETEGKQEFLSKVAEARQKFQAGDDRGGHAAASSALAMADTRLIQPQPGRMPLEPAAGLRGAEPPRPGGKGVAAEEQLYNLHGRITRLAAGEDRENLTQRFNKIADRLEDLNKRITMTNRNIAEMRKSGETSRTYKNKEGKTVTETLPQLEFRVLKLGKERAELASEDIPSLSDTLGAFERRPAARAPEAVPTELGPTTVPVYGERPAWEKGRPKPEAPKIGEKVITPSPAPVEEGQQAKIDELQAERRHLANLIKAGYGTSRKATDLRKTIRRIESAIGIHAPAPPPEVEATLAGERLLQAAKRAEPKPEPRPAVYAPETVQESPAEELYKYLKTAERSSPLIEKLVAPVPETGKIPLGDAADHISRPILEAFAKGDLTVGEAGHRLNRALEVLSEGRKAAGQLPQEQRATAMRKAFDNAIQIAKTGQLKRPGLGPEAGVFTLRGRPAQTVGGQALRNFMSRVATKGREIRASFERNREAKNLANSLSDVRQMNRGDVYHYYTIENSLRVPPRSRARIYDYREQQNLPANQRTLQLTPQEHNINNWITDVIRDNVRIRQKLGGRGFTAEEVAGLTHRVVKGKSQTYEQWLKGKMVTSGNVFSTFASSRMGAKYVAMEDPQSGQRLVVRVSKSGKVYAYGAGQQLGGDIGLKSEFENAGFRFKRATSPEISRAAGKEYYHDAIGPNIAENIALRRAERAHDFVEALKQEPEFQRMSTTNADVAKTMGFRRANVVNREWLPQFHNYYFEPHVAEVLEKEYSKFQKGDFSAYERMSNWLKRSIFWNPLIHTPNIAVHWQGEKGLTGMATQIFRPSEWRAHVQAFQVLTDPVKYHQMLEAGLPLMRQPNIRDVSNLFVAHATKDFGTALPNSRMDRLARRLGYTGGRDLAKRVFNPYRGASEITWASHDYAILQATFSRMAKNGWDLKTAADEVTKHIPNYRLPPRVWNSRTLGAIMDAPGISMFSQYHYGAFRSYGEMAKELIRPLKPGDRGRALDRMAALGFITYVMYPQMDKLARLMTGRSTAVWRRAGSSTFVYNVGKLYNSLFRAHRPGPKMGVLPFAESVISPAPVISAGIKAAQAKEITQKGQPLIGTPRKPGVAMKAGQIAAETVGAVAGYESGQVKPGKSPFQWRQFLFRMLGGRDEREVAKRGSGGLPGLTGLGKVK